MAQVYDVGLKPEVSGHVTGFDASSARQKHRIYPSFKRGYDLAVVLGALPIAIPLIALLALLVKLDGGSAFYCQPRVGRNGRIFRFWKLRTMVPDAEAKLQEHLEDNPAARAEWNESQKLQHDPRITRIGHILRKTSADELPQLWNVLTGDMSVVGPRPMLPEQQALYPGHAYYELRPGLTGFWQISDRNKCSFAGRAAFDTAYANSMSFWVDTMVLLKTFGVIVRCTGV